MASERIIIKGNKGSIFFEKDAGDDGTYEVSKELKLNAGNTAIEFDGSDIGAAGAKGTKGDTSFLGGAGGDKGYKGTTGPKGNKGATGEGGDDHAGDKGTKGTKGTKGDKATKGQKGVVGPTGTGEKGEAGAQGPGNKGQKGELGDKGTSTKGQKGEAGPQHGTKGAQGAKGTIGPENKGQKGTVGPTGSNATGAAGAKGAKGAPGSDGAAGEKGAGGGGAGGAGGEGGGAAGSSTQFQYNNSTAFGGADNLTFDGTDITVGAADSTAKLEFGDAGTYINQRADGDLQIVADDDIILRVADSAGKVTFRDAGDDICGHIVVLNNTIGFYGGAQASDALFVLDASGNATGTWNNIMLMATGGVTDVGTGQDSYVSFGSAAGNVTSASRDGSWVAPSNGKIIAWWVNYDGGLDNMGSMIPDFSVHTIYYGGSNVTKTSDGGFLGGADQSGNILSLGTAAHITVNAGELVSCKVDAKSGSGISGTHTIIFRADEFDTTTP